MAYRAPASEHDHASTEAASARRTPWELSRSTELSERQKRVLDCLQSSTSNLTLGQISSTVAEPADVVQTAIDDLIKRHLVCRLNTIIPSFAPRYPGIRVYAE